MIRKFYCQVSGEIITAIILTLKWAICEPVNIIYSIIYKYNLKLVVVEILFTINENTH